MDYYLAGGADYLAQRQGAASDHVQAMRASLFADLRADTLLDFGCGTGGVLSRLSAKRRIGIEIGPEAAAVARANGVEVHDSLSALDDDSVDVAISFHAIEHTEDPLAVLKEIHRVTRQRVRLIVPSEIGLIQKVWIPDQDKHLFTWTAESFGNLAEAANFKNIDCRVQPMVTGSRLVRSLSFIPPVSKAAHLALATKRNALNVVLNATV